jgi:hypothetical protein
MAARTKHDSLFVGSARDKGKKKFYNIDILSALGWITLLDKKVLKEKISGSLPSLGTML